MKTFQVCKDFLRMQHGVEVDPIKAAMLMLEIWGIRVDWHEMSDALEYLANAKDATRTGRTRDGMSKYIIE